MDVVNGIGILRDSGCERMPVPFNDIIEAVNQPISLLMKQASVLYYPPHLSLPINIPYAQ